MAAGSCRHAVREGFVTVIAKMPISLAYLSPANASAERELLVQFWQQQWGVSWSDDLAQRFFAWRYLERPSGETLLALDNGRCVATLDSFLRTYLMAGRCVTVRETADWFCLPEYRPLGLGLKLMRQMMAKPEPIIVIGGTAATQSLLPRLKWEPLPAVENYLLPVSIRALVGFGLRRRRAGSEVFARLIPSGLKIRRPRRLPPPVPSAQVCVSSNGRVPPPPPPDAYTLAVLIDKDSLRWNALAPKEVGDLITLNFVVDGMLVGISMSRLQRRVEGCTGKLLHLQSAEQSPAMIGWIVSETMLHLVDRGAGLIICRSSCPTIRAALRRVGCLSARPYPAFWWSARGIAPTSTMHLTKIVGNDDSDVVSV